MIGSGESCEVVLPTDGVSRKHLMIISDGDTFYVADQGSTNGTFINEERLIPGRRVEFTSFFPVRLGDDVLVSLISDDEDTGFTDASLKILTKEDKTNPTYDFESTKVLKLQNLGLEQTEKLVKRRQEKRASVKKTNQTNKVKPKPKSKKNKIVPFMAFALFLGAAGYQFYLNETKVTVKVSAPLKVGQIIERPVAPPVVDETILIDKTDMTPRESFVNLRNDIKCTTDMEKYLCEKIPSSQGNVFGVVQVGTMLNVLVDVSSYYEQAKKHLAAPSGEDVQVQLKYQEDLYQVAAVLFLFQDVPGDLDWGKLKDYKISFALYHPAASADEPRMILSFLSEGLEKFKNSVDIGRMKFVKKRGVNALSFTSRYYRQY